MILSYYVRRIKEKYRIRIVKKKIDLADVTLLSQNCIGGVMYHDCGSQFLSPMVNLFMLPMDFMKL